MAEKSKLHKLSELGQSVWIDFLSRDMLHSGELARMMKQDAVVGVTSNPTIFQKAISAGGPMTSSCVRCSRRSATRRKSFSG
jgi:transaldolase